LAIRCQQASTSRNLKASTLAGSPCATPARKSCAARLSRWASAAISGPCVTCPAAAPKTCWIVAVVATSWSLRPTNGDGDPAAGGVTAIATAGWGEESPRFWWISAYTEANDCQDARTDGGTGRVVTYRSTRS